MLNSVLNELFDFQSTVRPVAFSIAAPPFPVAHAGKENPLVACGYECTMHSSLKQVSVNLPQAG